MSTKRIAKRYAKPLLELAEEAKKLETVRKDLAGFSSICRENKEFLLMLKSPILTNVKKSEILDKIFKGKVDDLTLQVFRLLARKNREAFLPEMADEFVELYNDKMGIQKATVTTTFALDKKLKGEFEKAVTEITGKKPELAEKIDEHILGGYVLTLDDKQIDESISSQLSELRLKFKTEKN